MDVDNVRFVYSDTDSAPYGGGVGGSKTLYTLGNAVIRAAEDARRQTLAIAAEEFEVSAEDLEIVDGRVQVRGFPDRSVPLGDLAGKAMTFGGQYDPIHGSGSQAVTDRAPSFCAQIAEVEVDEETGEVNLLNLAVVQEVGRAINPLTVEGQMQGGAVQGVGWALFEEMRYDEDGPAAFGLVDGLRDAGRGASLADSDADGRGAFSQRALRRARRGRAARDSDGRGDCQCCRACHRRAHVADADDGAARPGGA